MIIQTKFSSSINDIKTSFQEENSEIATDLNVNYNVLADKDIYEGEYQVTPKAYDKQKLKTKNKTLIEDVTVLEVPFFKVDNNFGQTVSIGKGD